VPFTPVPNPQPREERASTSRARLASEASLWAATAGSLPAASRIASQGGQVSRGDERLLGLVPHGDGELVAAVDDLALGGQRLDVGLRGVGGGVGGLGAGVGGGRRGAGHAVGELAGEVGLLQRVGERLLRGPQLHPSLGGGEAVGERGGAGLGEELLPLGAKGGLAIAGESGEVPPLHQRGLAHVLPLVVERVLGGAGLDGQRGVRDE
jgi:hypothetical protein